MKNNKRRPRPWILAAFALVAIVFASAPQPAHAADKGTSLSALSFDFAPVPLVAQVDAPAPPVAVPASVPFWQDGAVIGGFIAFITSLLAIWSQKGLSQAQKVNRSLVIGIEAATKIPAVAAQEKRIKGIIKTYAEEHGVQPVLDRLVQGLT